MCVATATTLLIAAESRSTSTWTESTEPELRTQADELVSGGELALSFRNVDRSLVNPLSFDFAVALFFCSI